MWCIALRRYAEPTQERDERNNTLGGCPAPRDNEEALQTGRWAESLGADSALDGTDKAGVGKARQVVAIQIKPEDIEAGVTCNAWRNPVCLAIRRDAKVPGTQTITIHMKTARIGCCKVLRLPPEVYAWLDKLDTEGRDYVRPMSFEISNL